MYPELIIPPRGWAAVLADILMYPVMTAFAPWGESPQLTHKWNNIFLTWAQVKHLEHELMVTCEGDPEASPRTSTRDVMFHIARSERGWKKYIVLEPVDHKGRWYIGWIGTEGPKASQVPISGRVRMLRAPDDVDFFGVTPEGEQIHLREVGRGTIDDGGPFRKVPLH